MVLALTFNRLTSQRFYSIFLSFIFLFLFSRSFELRYHLLFSYLQRHTVFHLTETGARNFHLHPPSSLFTRKMKRPDADGDAASSTPAAAPATGRPAGRHQQSLPPEVMEILAPSLKIGGVAGMQLPCSPPCMSAVLRLTVARCMWPVPGRRGRHYPVCATCIFLRHHGRAVVYSVD